MHILISELRSLIREVLEDDENVRGIIPEDFFDSSRPISVRGNIYVPLQTAMAFKPGSRIARIVESLRTRFGVSVTPFDVMNTVKKDAIFKGQRQTITLTMSDENRGKIRALLADEIANYFKGSNVELVVPVESSSTMPREMAMLVAHKLNAVFDDTLVRKIERPEQLKLPVANTPQLQKIIDSTHAAALKKLAKGEKLSYTHDFGATVRRFFNMHAVHPSVDARFAKVVLVIDDNVDEGSTLKHIGEELKSRGIKPLLAAGFRKSKS
jgi:predicted phosphoribosyltransferase